MKLETITLDNNFLEQSKTEEFYFTISEDPLILMMSGYEG